ncbi:carboxypeptidase-like regulatory domain-containing protein [Mucilaginibacter sp. UR6-11]|uniref:carboxypeptidase-like regulatory domain-containing protein n=1 Tax=Mucilaginibacter sp. UR6-11 TaxID=1435644 RepID=UPI001E439E1F|nr:carboxypeptidase-like regulatory domain-containing protein [Mucilaginibacter sp. UR6-11]MCC8426762.1 carboxypeptidase-like regulatory domain-containing protein [Mucilaginibacter sp. UR6-11]
MKYLLALLTVLFLRFDSRAQAVYTISGTVKSSKGVALQSATVFVAGSEKIMATDANGSFNFKVKPGIYQLVVTMVGYNPLRQTIVIENKDEVLDAKLDESETVLNEVVIGSKVNKRRQWQLDIFTSYFIGKGSNSKDCKILNPQIIKFYENQTALFAISSDFLIIENQALGYRVRYLLKYFRGSFNGAYFHYDGDYSFEALTGTPAQQAIWENNRKLAYQGSMMHFLRSIYAGTARKEGFILYEVTAYDRPVVDMRPMPVHPDQIIKRTGNNLARFKFGDSWFYTLFDKEKAALEDPVTGNKDVRLYRIPRNGTVYKIYGQFDSEGCIEEYDIKNLYISGFMAQKRVADQLPFEYNPDKSPSSPN